MPFFDFKCQECGNVVELSVVWSKDMAEKLDPCQECGKVDWKRIFTVAQSKSKEFSQEEREVGEMMNKGWH